MKTFIILGHLYTQFVREMAPLCREAGLVLTVDVTMISMDPLSRGYDMGALGEAADYVVLMATMNTGRLPGARPVASALGGKGLSRCLEPGEPSWRTFYQDIS